jgi:sulfur relay (sulfurtransferase) DsrC/TusE family protein
MTADTGLEEARAARISAQERLAAAHAELIVPLRDLNQENHIQPLVNALIRKRVRKAAE